MLNIIEEKYKSINLGTRSQGLQRRINRIYDAVRILDSFDYSTTGSQNNAKRIHNDMKLKCVT